MDHFEQPIVTKKDVREACSALRREFFQEMADVGDRRGFKLGGTTPGRFLRALRQRTDAEFLLAYLMRGCRCVGSSCQSLLSSLPEKLSFGLVEAMREAILRETPSFFPHSLSHLLSHPLYFLGAIQSRKPYDLLLGNIFPYDPRGYFENLSSISYEESCATGASITWNIGPTATVGEIVAPEALALCSWIERQALDEELPYTGWVYVNLQNRQSWHESGRSHVIEQMGMEHERIFTCTLSVDSPYYLVEYATNHVSLEEVAAEMRRQLLCDSSSRGGYFFSLEKLHEKKAWHQCLSSLVDRALSSCREKGTDRSCHKAFQEILLYMVIRAWQGFCCRLQNGKYTPHLLCTIACREGVDRSGALEGGLVAFLQAETQEDVWRKALPIMWGRPLLFRGRLNEKFRMDGFFSLMALFSLKEIKKIIDNAFLLGYNMSDAV